MDDSRRNLEKTLSYLCNTCGSRHSGSSGEALALHYIEKEFQNYGYETVLEPYNAVGWNVHGFCLWNVTKGKMVPCSAPCYFSNSVDIEKELLWISPDQVRHLADIPVRGCLCFVEFWNDDSVPGVNVSERNKVAEELDKLGAAAAIFISCIHSDLAPSTKIERSPFLEHLAVATVSLPGVMDIAKNKKDVYRLIIDAKKFNHVSYNVIARVSGKSCKKLVFGAHYDTAPNIQGAGDNGSGTAMLLEVARLLRDKLSDWSVDFVAFSGEEYMMHDRQVGSSEYLKLHSNEDIAWYYNFDAGCQCIGEVVSEITHLEKLPKDYVPIRRLVPASLCGDDQPFSLKGIPTIWLHNINPFHYIHTAEDTIDKIDFERMVTETKTNVENILQLIGKSKI